MAARKTRTRKTGPVAGATLLFLGLSGLVSSLDGTICRLATFLGIPSWAAGETVPSIVLGAWHILQPCAFGHLRLLEALLQISGPCWQFVLTLAGAA